MTEVLLQEEPLAPNEAQVQYSLYDLDKQSELNAASQQASPLKHPDDVTPPTPSSAQSRQGTVFGSTFNLVVAVVGAGVLSFPFAFRESGLVLSLLLLCVSTIFAFLSLKLLVISSDYIVTPELAKQPSFRALALECGGPKLAHFTQLTVILSLLGSMISRIVGAAGIIVILYYALDSGANSAQSGLYYKLCIVAFTLFPILPLSLLRSINSLRFTSLLSVVCSVYLTVVLVASYFDFCDASHYRFDTCFWSGDDFKNALYEMHDHKHLWNFSNVSGVLTTFPIFVFGYNCQPNVFGIYTELKDKNVDTMMRVVRNALCISVSLYVLGGSFAYMTFLDDTCGNILLNRFDKAPQAVIAAVIFCVSMILATPVFVNVIRKNVVNFVYENKDQAVLKWHVIITLAVLVFGCGVSAFVTDIATVFGFIGCTTNPITGYILPTYFFHKLVPKGEYKGLRIASIAMSVVVIIVSLGSFVYKIYAIAEDIETSCDQAQDIE